jgi:hypothetical protein
MRPIRPSSPLAVLEVSGSFGGLGLRNELVVFDDQSFSLFKDNTVTGVQENSHRQQVPGYLWGPPYFRKRKSGGEGFNTAAICQYDGIVSNTHPPGGG